MNVRLLPRIVARGARALAVLLLAWWAIQFFSRPSYSYKFRHDCANTLVLTRYQAFQAGYHDPKAWVPCRWSGKIVLVCLMPGDAVDVHPANNLLGRRFVARSEDEATVVGFVNEARGPRGGLGGRAGGALYVVLSNPKNKELLGVALVKEWTAKPTDAEFEGEYAALARKIEELHD